MNYKKIEGIAYNLHLIKTNKFKKNMIKINFKNKIIKEDIVKRRMIPNILVESNSMNMLWHKFEGCLLSMLIDEEKRKKDAIKIYSLIDKHNRIFL